MYKKLFFLIAFVLFVLPSGARDLPGGVKGVIVNRAGRIPVEHASVELTAGDRTVASGYSDSDGNFIFTNIEDGMYSMVVNASGFMETRINVTVEGHIKDMMFISLVSSQIVREVDDASFAEFDMEDSGYSDAPSILFSSNDVYTNIAGFGFSQIRFRNRGYTNESQDVYVSGVKMNDAITGYSPYSLWSGLNEAMRSKETVMGSEVSDYGFGGYNGLTNILANPMSIRPGWRFSLLSNSALYRLRLMANYASGELDNGWAYAFNVSARLGGNDWVDGVYYRSFAYYFGVEKKFSDVHRLGFMAFAAPGQRGAQNASTQEVYDLVGDNMYNSNWGYQNGKVRNARVRKTHEPVFILKYTATPNDNLETDVTFLYRTGKNGYTALDWYDAPDPRPDYYRNLPSYFWTDNTDINRDNPEKYAWAKEAWESDYASTRHVDWDRLYNVNRFNVDSDGLKRSKYVIEQRRVDQHDINLNMNLKWRASRLFTLTGGVNLKWNRSEHYKLMDDLLGGEYYLNIDQFAERDFAASPTMIQNDLDYFFEHGKPQQLAKGDKYGYDYYAHVRNAGLWANAAFNVGSLNINLAAEAGYNSFWREGLVRKGLFAGLDDNGEEIFYNGQKLTTYDPHTGEAITSKGRSAVNEFFVYSGKLGLNYNFSGGHRIFADASYINDAPTFSQAYISPRTRNSINPNITTIKTVSGDINYQYSNQGYDLRVTAFWTKIMDQTDMMSFYDDSQNSFVNFAMSGIDQRHAGLELGFRIPFFLEGLSLQGVVSWGEYVYTSAPRMTMTIDNSSAVIFDDVMLPYWASHPVYRKTVKDGVTTYDKDDNGNYIIEKYQKHYVPSSPQLATNLGFNYRTNSYWFFELNAQYFANSYLDMNPLYRTDMILAGPDLITTPEEVEYMASQERFDPAFLLNASIGKSWYIDRKYNIGFSLQVNNILNNRNVKTGGYEQTRLVDSKSGERYYRFDSKYFYMYGANYMLNLYFRF